MPPVLVLACRRPGITDRLLSLLAASGCRELFVVVDGPRPARAGDLEQVERTREAVRKHGVPVDHLMIRETNMGGPRGIPAALDWFFARNGSGIILEDDLQPDPSFFQFAAELLERFEHEPRVAAIHGWTCRLRPPPDSYYFSRYAPGWGWATWASRWKDFDREGRLWFDRDPVRVLREVAAGDEGFVSYWFKLLQKVYVGGAMNWDYRWVFTNFALGRLTATTGVNLVDNIGWGSDATHTGSKPFCQLPAHAMGFPLRHPRELRPDDAADRDEHLASFLATPSMRLRYAFAALSRWTASVTR